MSRKCPTDEPPCVVCGSPISHGNLGHDNGCMLGPTAVRTDAKTDLEKTLLDALADLAFSVDEDVPHEYRTKHLRVALEDALIVVFPEEVER
mgnify:CR=1 FL=1